MGSFTDAITQFNPYVSQLPVDAMVKVGMQKQAQYEEGYKKIQSQIDQVAGLDVLRDVDKNYLQTKLNDLGNNLRTVAAGDFSNFQLVNSIGGMTKQVARDEYVQAAVSSTANHRKQASEMEADKKKGNLTPENEYYYNKQFSSYLGSKDLKNKDGKPIIYSGKYIPNFDVFKFAKETFDAIKPDGMSFDQVYITDGNGNPKVDAKGQPVYSPTMVRMEQEGIFPAKVKETLSQIFSDPRVAQQLNITGQYNYRNMTPDQLSGKILDQKDNVMAGYTHQLNDLAIKKNSGKDVQKEIDAITQQMDSMSSTYDDYAKTAFDNPDGVKGQLYKDDVNARYTTMFGWIKKKEQTMENPGWNANFKLLAEENQQSRFAQELHQRKLEFAEKNKQWQADYLQKERLSTKKKGAGPGEGGDGTGTSGQAPTQGNQPSNIDPIQKFEQDYTETATTFKGASDDFLWNNVFSGVGNNDAELTKLVNSGMNRNQAMSLMIDNAAKNSKQDPLDFRATWGNKAEVNYFKMTPAQKAANPSITNAYNTYRSARRNFDDMSTIKKTVDSQTEAALGSELSKKLTTGNVKAVTGILNGQQITVTVDDQYDLAIYLRGNKSSLGFVNDAGARQAAEAARQRLAARGKDGLIGIMMQNTSNSVANKSVSMWDKIKNPITTVTRMLGDIGNDQPFARPGGMNAPDLSQVTEIYSRIDNDEYTNGLKVKSDIIKKAYGIKPNLNQGLMSDDVGTNRITFKNMQNLSGAYMSGQAMNLSPDFKQFAKYIGSAKNLEDANVQAQVVMDANNQPQVELVAYDSDGERAGGMIIQRDEAMNNFNIDVNSLYESKDISITRHKIDVNGNKTSAGNPKDIKTYVNGDTQFDRQDFTGMGNAPYDVKANIILRGGIYYPILYASDGRNFTKVPRELEGSENLQQVITFLKQSVNPTFVSSIIAESAVLNQ